MKKIFGFALLVLPAAVMADTSVGLRAGTLGGGLEVAHAFSQGFGMRVDVDGYNLSRSITQDNIDYDAKLKLKTASLLADWFPFAGNFRISAGAMYNGNKLSLAGKPTGGTFVINGNTYNAADVGSFDGQVDFRKIAPYAGIGYGRPIGTGFSLTFDLGVMGQGSPRSKIAVTCGPATPPATCTSLQNDAAAEQARLDDSLHNFRLYPVVSLGLAYTF
jgi:hypothetical protein